MTRFRVILFPPARKTGDFAMLSNPCFKITTAIQIAITYFKVWCNALYLLHK